MKITEIKGPNKIRDYKVCHLWMEGRLTNAEIAQKMCISERCVGRIIYKNRGVLKSDADFEKAFRIRWLKSQISKAENSKKDPAELMEQLRKEIEGDGANTSNQPIIQIINYARENNSSSPEVSRRNDRVPEANIARF